MGGGYSPYPPFIHILFYFKENNTKGGGGGGGGGGWHASNRVAV